MARKNLKLSQFPPMLPYGLTSRHALQLFLPHSEAAWIEYSPDTTMEERLARCSKDNAVHNLTIAHLVKGGYLEKSYHRFGTNRVENYLAYQITRPTLNLLTGAYDPETEQKRISECIKNGIPENVAQNYISTVKHGYSPRNFYEKACMNDRTAFYEELTLAVFLNHLSPLAINTIHTAKVDLSQKGINGQRQYRSYRLVNIMSLFQANNFLTRLDHRYIEPELNIKPDYDDETKQIPFFEFVHDSLRQWYAFKQDAVSYYNTKLVKSEATLNAWKTSPVFYDITELPGFGNLTMDDFELPLTGATNITRHTFQGIAIGKTDNYLVYHTRPSFTPWNTEIEASSAQSAQVAFEKMCGGKPHIGKDRIINKALIICDSVHQFKNLFEPQKSLYSPSKLNPKRFASPYYSLHILPVDQSSVMVLNMLMKASPETVERHIINLLLSKNKGFYKSTDNLMQLGYCNKPVLVAHTMEYHKLSAAYKLYKEQGLRFYISCYPEQVLYLKKLFPYCDFL